MALFSRFKTSEKITIFFSIFNIISLVTLLLSINVAYFFIWYNDQKEKSWYDMNMNYQKIVGNTETNTQAFTKYILQKDTIIIPQNGDDIVCSEWVAKKLHNDLELVKEVKDSLFYREDWVVYLIFTNTYEEIGEVKVFFDMTEYIESQMTIIKISLILILISVMLYYVGWRMLTHYILKNLKHISQRSQEIDLNTDWKKIDIASPDDDEIQILARVLNTSFEKIKKQSENQKQFITDVSHELKTPLMVINSKIDVYNKKCEKGSCGIKEMVELKRDIKNNTRKLNKILETLLLLSRFEWNEVDYNRVEANIWNVLESITEDVLTHSNKNIIVDYKLQKNVVQSIELTTFTIMIENLLTNACKFSPEWWIIEVWVDDERIWVRDNWVWIAHDEREKIFEKFFRKDHLIEWFGVGLNIVKRIVNFYNWRIGVESIEWEWSCFSIYFEK